MPDGTNSFLVLIFNLLKGDLFEKENRNAISPTRLCKYKLRSSKALALSEETVALIPSGVRIIVPLILLLLQ